MKDTGHRDSGAARAHGNATRFWSDVTCIFYTRNAPQPRARGSQNSDLKAHGSYRLGRHLQLLAELLLLTQLGGVDHAAGRIAKDYPMLSRPVTSKEFLSSTSGTTERAETTRGYTTRDHTAGIRRQPCFDGSAARSAHVPGNGSRAAEDESHALMGEVSGGVKHQGAAAVDHSDAMRPSVLGR